MNCKDCRTFGSLWAIGQGLLCALLPQVSVAVTKKLLGKCFENAEDLEAKPKYRRQIRAAGVGLAAAGIAGLALERAGDDE
jgi:hypothetical protein